MQTGQHRLLRKELARQSFKLQNCSRVLWTRAWMGCARAQAAKIVCAGNVRTNLSSKAVAPSLATHSSLSSIGSGPVIAQRGSIGGERIGVRVAACHRGTCGGSSHAAAAQAACSLRQSGCRRPSCWRMAAARAAGLLLNAGGAIKPSVRPPMTCSAHQQQLTELLTSLDAIAAS